MTIIGWLQIGLLFLTVLLVVKPLGLYMARVFSDGRTVLSPILAPVERGLYAAAGVDPAREQSWLAYTLSMLAFSLVGFVSLYAILQLPGMAAAEPAGLRQRPSGPRLQHGGQLRHQHQLADLCRRDDDEPFQPDGRADGAQLRFGRDRHRHGACRDAGLRALGRVDGRQLLGRSRPRDPLCPAADCHRRGARLRGDGPAADARRLGGCDDARRREADDRARTDRQPGGDQAARHERRRLPERQRRASVRKPDGTLQLPQHLRDAVDHRRRSLYTFGQTGRQSPPGLGLHRRDRHPS